MKIGIVGLGRMGGNIARRLMRGGHEVVVWDRNDDAVSGLAGEGAIGASSLADMKDKLGVAADMDLLTKVVIGCGPSIYNADSETVSGSDKTEVDRVKTNFLIKKLGLADGPALDEAIAKVLADYGSANRNKYRAVVYYMLTKHFGKEAAYA